MEIKHSVKYLLDEATTVLIIHISSNFNLVFLINQISLESYFY